MLEHIYLGKSIIYKYYDNHSNWWPCGKQADSTSLRTKENVYRWQMVWKNSYQFLSKGVYNTIFFIPKGLYLNNFPFCHMAFGDSYLPLVCMAWSSPSHLLHIVQLINMETIWIVSLSTTINYSHVANKRILV